jgi:hypothetical protein
MADVAIVLALVGSSIALALGVTVLPRRLRALIDASRPNPSREQAFALQASIEVCNLAADREYGEIAPWTDADEARYQQARSRYYVSREIAATKRGDLLAAARFAEVAGG